MGDTICFGVGGELTMKPSTTTTHIFAGDIDAEKGMAYGRHGKYPKPLQSQLASVSGV